MKIAAISIVIVYALLLVFLAGVFTERARARRQQLGDLKAEFLRAQTSLLTVPRAQQARSNTAPVQRMTNGAVRHG